MSHFAVKWFRIFAHVTTRNHKKHTPPKTQPQRQQIGECFFNPKKITIFRRFSHAVRQDDAQITAKLNPQSLHQWAQTTENQH